MFQQDGERIGRLDDLKVGDYVVHISHGIGRYLGVKNSKLGMLNGLFNYQVCREDRLYVPTDQIELLQKYVAGEGSAKVHKLGSDWQTKLKVTACKKLAEGLLELYAKRQGMPGYAFSADDNWQRNLKTLFPIRRLPTN